MPDPTFRECCGALYEDDVHALNCPRRCSACGGDLDTCEHGLRAQRKRRGRNSKARAKTYERDIARALGGTRYPADTGGKLDVLAEPFGFQVKSGLSVVTQTMRTGMAEAVAGCLGTALIPALALIDRRGSRNDKYIVLRLTDWCDLHRNAKDDECQG